VLAHSPRLKSLDREVDAAEARNDQARAQALPLLSADARATQYAGLQDTELGPGVVIPAIESRYGAGVMLSQPAYTGGRLKGQKQAAGFQAGAARQDRRSAEADLVLETLAAYWLWSKAFYSVGSLTSAVARMEAHAVDMANLHQAGLATDNDALATDVLLDQTRLRLAEAERRVDVARARLAYLSGQPLPASGAPVKAAVPLDGVMPPETILLETAQTNRAERMARALETQAAEAQVRTARADYYPQVALVARYEQMRPNLLELPPQERWQDDASVGVAVSWNLFDWGLRRAKVAEASARSAQARLREEQLAEGITLEVRESWINFRDTRERVVVAERVVQSARRNLTAATDLWQNGLARHSDVLDAHAQLTSAEYEVIAAQADLAVARSALDHAVGRLQPEVP
jgi:outer membrane protein